MLSNRIHHNNSAHTRTHSPIDISLTKCRNAHTKSGIIWTWSVCLAIFIVASPLGWGFVLWWCCCWWLSSLLLGFAAHFFVVFLFSRSVASSRVPCCCAPCSRGARSLHTVSLVRHLRCVAGDRRPWIRLCVLTGRNAHRAGGDHELLFLNDHRLFVVRLFALLLALHVVADQRVHFGGVFAGDLECRAQLIQRWNLINRKSWSHLNQVGHGKVHDVVAPRQFQDDVWSQEVVAL